MTDALEAIRQQQAEALRALRKPPAVRRRRRNYTVLEPVRYTCVYCGHPTRQQQVVCTHHRDLPALDESFHS